jgi:hypothetical protein
MSLRILANVFPRQSASSAILLSINFGADRLRLELGFFMFGKPNAYCHEFARILHSVFIARPWRLPFPALEWQGRPSA